MDGPGIDNVLDKSANHRGLERLPLKSGDWNRLKLSLNDATAVIELNGVKVCERVMGRRHSRAFGLFHYKDRTSVRVREIVLTGDWPNTMDGDLAADLFSGSKEAADRRNHVALMGEETWARTAGDVLKTAAVHSLLRASMRS